MKRSLDFIPKCDGKLLEGFKQRSDITLCMLKKITEAAALIKKGIRGHLGCFIAVIQLGDKPGELPGLGGVGGSCENDQVWDVPGRWTFTFKALLLAVEREKEKSRMREKECLLGLVLIN